MLGDRVLSVIYVLPWGGRDRQLRNCFALGSKWRPDEYTKIVSVQNVN